jgi:hypothetical protein
MISRPTILFRIDLFLRYLSAWVSQRTSNINLKKRMFHDIMATARIELHRFKPEAQSVVAVFGDAERDKQATAKGGKLEERLFNAVSKGWHKVVIQMAGVGVDMNARDKEGKTPFIQASIKNDIEMLKVLALFGAEVDKKDKSGKTALMHAAINDQVGTINALIVLGASAEVEDKKKMNALMHAQASTKPNADRIIQLLTYEKPNKKIRTIEGEIAINKEELLYLRRQHIWG